MLVDAEMDFDAPDLLAAINAALEAAWRRATCPAVHDHGTQLRGIAAGQLPRAAQPVERAAPQAAPDPAKQRREQVLNKTRG